MNETELTELASVCQTWRRAELSPPPAPAQWAVTRDFPLAAGQSERLTLEGPGVIRQMHFRMQPLSEAALRGVQVQMRWEGEERPAVDVALGDLFGWAAATRSPEARFNSLAAGANGDEAYFCMPMPFSKRAEITFENRAKEPIQQLSARLAVENTELPPNWGRFHVSWRKNRAAAPDLPRFGPKNVPVQLVLDETGRGKYVGVLLQVDWPWVHWWGEGDWLIWTDESEWPPSYHGTGSEEYFNAGWCEFDRKAVSGYVTEHPGWAAVYSHHLNDAFQFEKNIRVAEEMMGFGEGDKLIHSEHPQWMSTAYWYAAP